MNALMPSRDRRLTALRTGRRLYTGLNAVSHRLQGVYRRRRGVLVELRAEAERIDGLGNSYRHISQSRLKEKLATASAISAAIRRLSARRSMTRWR